MTEITNALVPYAINGLIFLEGIDGTVKYYRSKSQNGNGNSGHYVDKDVCDEKHKGLQELISSKFIDGERRMGSIEETLPF